RVGAPAPVIGPDVAGVADPSAGFPGCQDENVLTVGDHARVVVVRAPTLRSPVEVVTDHQTRFLSAAPCRSHPQISEGGDFSTCRRAATWTSSRRLSVCAKRDHPTIMKRHFVIRKSTGSREARAPDS